MATHPTLAHRLVLAGGFAVAVAAAPLITAVANPTGPAAPALAQCPPNEVVDPTTGTCMPVTAVAPQANSPIEPGVTDLAPGAITQSDAGNVGQIPEINGIPCEGDNTGLCMGLQENNPAKNDGVVMPQVPMGPTP